MLIKKAMTTMRDVLDKALKGSIATSAFLMGGGTPFMNSRQAYAQAADLSSQALRTVGLSVTVQERILEDFKAKSGVGEISGKADIFPNTQTELLSGSTAYDCWEIDRRAPAGDDRDQHHRPDRHFRSFQLGQHPQHLRRCRSEHRTACADLRSDLGR